MKIWTTTFGCKVNQYETELLRHRLSGRQSQQVKTPKEADLCLINTCSVTSFADKEARQMIRRVLRENEFARVVITGCYATRAPKEIQDISERLEVYTNEQKDELPSCVGYEVSEQPLGIHQFAGRTRAFLKIQDGCKAPCNYCIIPTVRPRMNSKPVENVLSEAQALLKNGYQELVLTGIRLGLYRDGTTNLAALLKKLIALPGNFRIRLSSLEVTEVSDEIIQLTANNKKICRHFHIPMQAGDDSVLKSMKRWYNTEFYRNKIKSIRAALPDCGLTADVMVGYPTETEEQFENTFNFIKELALSGLHVFRFSVREGTPAAQLKPLDPKIVSKRARVLGELSTYLKEQFYLKHEGTVRETLPEPSGAGWTDNYIRVKTGESASRLGLLHIKEQVI